MSPSLLQAKKAEKSIWILLGVNNSQLDSNTLEQEQTDRSLQLRAFPSSFQAYRWLESRVGKPDQLSKVNAVVCSYGFLEEDRFMLLHNIRQHDELKVLPFIVIHDEPLKNSEELLRMGVDDCYSAPVDATILEQRVSFLRKFKKELMLKHPQQKQKRFSSKIPFFKRAFDIVFASLVILAISPLLALIALAIKIESRGDIIYRSKRVGTGYQVFDFLKFRSMYPDADERLQEMLAQNQYKGEKGNVFVKFNNDPRVTRVGRFIRKTSFDELPQLFNVLLGDMSIVGNRPLPLYEAETLTRDAWVQRFLAPAGMTGLWQISKRGKKDMSVEERIGLDIQYAENHSLWYDIKILAKTPMAMIQEEDV